MRLLCHVATVAYLLLAFASIHAGLWPLGLLALMMAGVFQFFSLQG